VYRCRKCRYVVACMESFKSGKGMICRSIRCTHCLWCTSTCYG
jgi:hypothetical protein